MGIDILDVIYRLERRFGIVMRREDWIELMRKNGIADIPVGDLFALIKDRIRSSNAMDDEIDADWTWPAFQIEISHALGVEPDEVQPDRWIVGDLGAS